MDAAEFNALYDAAVGKPLRAEGFVQRRQNYFYETDTAVLALLRFQGKLGGLLQATNFIVGMRHKFLRELIGERIPKSFPTRIDDYPVKIRPSTLSWVGVRAWRYQPINLAIRSDHYDSLEYGGAASPVDINNVLTGVSGAGPGNRDNSLGGSIQKSREREG